MEAKIKKATDKGKVKKKEYIGNSFNDLKGDLAKNFNLVYLWTFFNLISIL